MLGESYTPEDEEDSSIAEITNIWVYQARYRIPLKLAMAGNWVLVEGIDATITKTATVVPEFHDEDLHIFKPLQFMAQSVMKIATEPLNPSELPKMVPSRAYPSRCPPDNALVGCRAAIEAA